jgi:hypothetical protein
MIFLGNNITLIGIGNWWTKHGMILKQKFEMLNTSKCLCLNLRWMYIYCIRPVDLRWMHVYRAIFFASFSTICTWHQQPPNVRPKVFPAEGVEKAAFNITDYHLKFQRIIYLRWLELHRVSVGGVRSAVSTAAVHGGHKLRRSPPQGASSIGAGYRRKLETLVLQCKDWFPT